VSLLYAQLQIFFSTVRVLKPKSSRNSSMEAFILGQNFACPPGYTPTMIDPFTCAVTSDFQCEGPMKVIPPFLACGDLSAFDSDMNYPLAEGGDCDSYISLEPVQPPINPPYKAAIERMKGTA